MSTSPSTRTSERIEVTGIVQGVGFRPFVHRLASELGLAGIVGNDSARVFAEVTGDPAVIAEFAARISSDAPPLAFVEDVRRARVEEVPDRQGFRIVESARVGGPRTLVPPDTGVCDDCLDELFDPTNRRYRHPFITCTNCGPRFTIITDLPYDRPNTTMDSFAMCTSCAREYRDPADRRYHAQPIGCHECGPTLRHHTADGYSVAGDGALDLAAEALLGGRVLALKGLGGFHLAVDATDDDAVGVLRTRKHRPDKPLAVMVADLDAAHRLVELGPAEERLLGSPARPVVLAAARPDNGIAPAVAPGNPLLGVMLAYTPVHHLLLERVARPVVMTSANLSGEPIIHRDADIESQLGSVADALLTNDRPIAAPCDDSVVRVIDDGLLPIRRGRGYAPVPVPIDGGGRAVLGVGGELKNTFCVCSGTHAWMSPHIGDMGTLATLRTFEEAVDRFTAMYDVTPEVVATDAHPGYVVTRWAHRTSGDTVSEVQHHHAHVAAVMAEHRLSPTEPVLGFAFDGTGYGDDGTIWGGEALRATASGYERLAHLVAVALPGGDAAIQHPARAALAHLDAAGIEWTQDLPPVEALTSEERDLLARMLSSGFGCVPTTSMGRLFDAVASLLGLRHLISYEAQAAIDLEHAAVRNVHRPCTYRFEMTDGLLDQRPLLDDIVHDLRRGRPVEAVADGFHHAVADAVRSLADRFAADGTTVVLSGGVFQNALLTRRTLGALRAGGHHACTHRLVPPNDGGLALGQAYIATHSPTPSEL